MIKELKAFLLRGDVVTLAVAVIIAAAFGKIVTSLVEDVITPLMGSVLQVPDFSAWTVGGVKLGSFINAIINFIVVGITLFFVVKAADKNAEEVN